jgi:hypothetical protein
MCRRSITDIYHDLHKHGQVLHTDVRSRHITLDSSGRVRVLDWEAAHILKDYSPKQAALACLSEMKTVGKLLGRHTRWDEEEGGSVVPALTHDNGGRTS